MLRTRLQHFARHARQPAQVPPDTKGRLLFPTAAASAVIPAPKYPCSIPKGMAASTPPTTLDCQRCRRPNPSRPPPAMRPNQYENPHPVGDPIAFERTEECAECDQQAPQEDDERTCRGFNGTNKHSYAAKNNQNARPETAAFGSCHKRILPMPLRQPKSKKFFQSLISSMQLVLLQLFG